MSWVYVFPKSNFANWNYTCFLHDLNSDTNSISFYDNSYSKSAFEIFMIRMHFQR